MAIDGSESSLHAIDHVCFVISNNPNVRLTLLHVTNNARNYCGIDLDEESIHKLKEIVALGDKACIEHFYPLAKKKFYDAGISQDQIEMKTVKGGRQVGDPLITMADYSHNRSCHKRIPYRQPDVSAITHYLSTISSS